MRTITRFIRYSFKAFITSNKCRIITSLSQHSLYVTHCYIIIVTFCYNKVNKIIERKVYLTGLREIRKKRHLNQQKVAMDLNISREALSYYENGKREPSLSLLVRMSEYFNVSINYLITGKEFIKK